MSRRATSHGQSDEEHRRMSVVSRVAIAIRSGISNPFRLLPTRHAAALLASLLLPSVRVLLPCASVGAQHRYTCAKRLGPS
jgi:hypothetical protein